MLDRSITWQRVQTTGINSVIYTNSRNQVLKVARPRTHAQVRPLEVMRCYAALQARAPEHVARVNMIHQCIAQGVPTLIMVMDNAGMIAPTNLHVTTLMLHRATADMARTRVLSQDLLVNPLSGEVNIGNLAFVVHDQRLVPRFIDLDDTKQYMLVDERHVRDLTLVYDIILRACLRWPTPYSLDVIKAMETLKCNWKPLCPG